MTYDPLGLEPDPGKPVPLDFHANREARFISKQLTDFASGNGGYVNASYAELAELIWRPNRLGVEPSAVAIARLRLVTAAKDGNPTATRLLRELEEDAAALPVAVGNTTVAIGRVGLPPMIESERRLTASDDPFAF